MGGQRTKVFVISGGTGTTADQVLNAALAQFEQPAIEIIHRPNIRSAERAVKVVGAAAKEDGIVCQTLVSPKVREAVNEELLRLDVPSVDILGPVISLLADHLGEAPRGRAGLLYELQKEQFDRRDAVDFSLAHDDGQRVHDLAEADVVVVGVSRASKSVTCFYLAARGIRAANVPIGPQIPLPPQLERMDPERVIGLTMNAARLLAVRQARLERITHRNVDGYAEQRDVAREIGYAMQLMEKHKWRRIDVSYKATEEVAMEIVEMLPPRKRSRKARSRSK